MEDQIKEYKSRLHWLPLTWLQCVIIPTHSKPRPIVLLT